MGIPSYDVTRSLMAYAFLRRSLDADYVTVYHGMNDLFQHTNGGMRVVPKQNYSGRVFEPFVYEGDASREALWREVLRSFTRRSLLVMLIREQRKALSGADRAWVHAPDPAGLEAFAIRYRALLDQIEASGSTPIPMTFAVADPDGFDAPDRERIERSFAIWLEGQGISLDAGRQILERQNQGIAALSHTRGNSLADVASAVPGDRQHFIDACHLTVAGNLRIAETLAETLMPLIDALPSSG